MNDVDEIARQAAHSHAIGTPLQPVIAAAIRRALEPWTERLTDLSKENSAAENALKNCKTQRDAAIALLRQIEALPGHCPICFGEITHSDDCQLAKAIAK